MTTTLPSKAAVDRAQPLDFPDRQERQGNITIEAGATGLIVRFEYTGALSSIPAAIERLKQAGILELVRCAVPAVAPASVSKKKVSPVYQPDGSPACPVHLKPLREGSYGLHCTAKDPSGKNGYCDLKFDV